MCVFPCSNRSPRPPEHNFAGAQQVSCGKRIRLNDSKVRMNEVKPILCLCLCGPRQRSYRGGGSVPIRMLNSVEGKPSEARGITSYRLKWRQSGVHTLWVFCQTALIGWYGLQLRVPGSFAPFSLQHALVLIVLLFVVLCTRVNLMPPGLYCQTRPTNRWCWGWGLGSSDGGEFLFSWNTSKRCDIKTKIIQQ